MCPPLIIETVQQQNNANVFCVTSSSRNKSVKHTFSQLGLFWTEPTPQRRQIKATKRWSGSFIAQPRQCSRPCQNINTTAEAKYFLRRAPNSKHRALQCIICQPSRAAPHVHYVQSAHALQTTPLILIDIKQCKNVTVTQHWHYHISRKPFGRRR